MSSIALQRVIVRMMFDIDFTKAVFRNARHAIEDEKVTDEECAWLVNCDPRAYATDPHFVGRTLHGLVGEYLVSCAIAVRANAPLNRFFSSPRLHQCVQSGHSLPLAFGDWLIHERRIRDSRVAQLAMLEHALATLRRRPQSDTGEAREAMSHQAILAPDIELIKVTNGALNIFTHVKNQIERRSANPNEIALNSTVNLPIPTLAMGKEHLLLERKSIDDISIETLNPALADILNQAKLGATLNELHQIARNHGADPGEDQEVINDLASDGLLILQ